VLGLFHLQRLKIGLKASKDTTLTGRGLDIAVMAAEELGSALANLGLQESLRDQVIRDPLTGLFNRQFFEELLLREMARAERKTQQLSVVVLDIDHFKNINDTFGHSAGDAVLRNIGPLLRAHVRESDVACRIGGEEFLLLLSELPLPIAVQRAEAIRKALRQISVKFGDKVLEPVTASFGAAAYPYHGRTVEALFRAADEALLDAKRAGRDRVVAAPLPE
jgi:diguanylate cyclase (GGDEF)-like protein